MTPVGLLYRRLGGTNLERRAKLIRAASPGMRQLTVVRASKSFVQVSEEKPELLKISTAEMNRLPHLACVVAVLEPTQRSEAVGDHQRRLTGMFRLSVEYVLPPGQWRLATMTVHK